MAVDITNHLIPWAIAKRMQADAWDEGYEAGNYDTREFDAVTECRVDYDEYEDTPNPYRGRAMSALSDRSEYGLRHINNERVFHMRSLTEAINTWKLQDFPDHWQIVERPISRWTEVE